MKLYQLVIYELSKKRFRASIRTAVRGLWTGVFTKKQFTKEMKLAIKNGLHRAWSEGAAVCGIAPDERTAEEQAALDAMVAGQYKYIGGFAKAIIRGNKANKGLLREMFKRAEMWIDRYQDAYFQAQNMACANKKLKWVLGPTEHCKSCLKLEGKVKRATIWAKNDIRPKHPRLECGGFKCQCKLMPTNERGTPGRLPKIP